MKFYIDSDGVIADFKGWLESHDSEVPEGNDALTWLTYNHYDEAFLNLDECPMGEYFINRVKKDENCYILTSVVSDRKFLRKYPNLDPSEALRRAETLKENKWRWYEKRGVPRDKVIIVWSWIDKSRYCGEGNVLIDNSWKNVYVWNKNGGKGHIFTNKDSAETLDKIFTK